MTAIAGRPVTVKLGGVAGRHAEALAALARLAPPTLVLVHGGGGEVADWSRRLGLEPRMHDGLRVTDPATLDVAVAVLAGLVNTRLVAALGALERPSLGMTGVDGGLLEVRRREPALGDVGEVVRADPGLLVSVLAAGVTPVVASIAADGAGSLLNVNADEAAGAIAAARGGLLVLATDVGGVHRGDRVAPTLGSDDVAAMLADGTASAGMRPKLAAALVAARAGCEVRILDGRSPDALGRALRGEPAGTIVTAA